MNAAFPPYFLWGAATAAYQVEGHNIRSDFYAWEQQPNRIADNTTCGSGAGWWEGRAETDLLDAARMGHNAHRLSFEWSRLEPEPNRYDVAAFERYREILGAAKAAGLAICATVNHFTLPRWAKGGWTEPALVERFGALSRRCGQAFGDLVSLWATLNEPVVLGQGSYLGTRWPPGLGRLSAFMSAMQNMMRAHVAGYRALHDVLPNPRVGLVMAMQSYGPASDRRRDRVVASGHDWIFNGALVEALRRGVMLAPLCRIPRRIDGLKESFDWLGVNYYGRYLVRFAPAAVGSAFGRHVQRHGVRNHLSGSDWGEVFPQGLTCALTRVASLGVPLYVTENGVLDPGDERRTDYLIRHIQATHAAIDRGADVCGYFVWTLVDNFEWAEGWSAPFGLIALDRHTQVRTRRSSASVYSRICRSNSITVG